MARQTVEILTATETNYPFYSERLVARLTRTEARSLARHILSLTDIPKDGQQQIIFDGARGKRALTVRTKMSVTTWPGGVNGLVERGRQDALDGKPREAFYDLPNIRHTEIERGRYETGWRDARKEMRHS